MPVTFIGRKRPDGTIAPVDAAGYAEMESVSATRDVKVQITQSRNPDFHRLFFALVHYLHGLQDTWPTVDALRARLTVAAGHGTSVTRNGMTVLLPDSISFAAMDETSFRKFFLSVVDVFFTTIAPHLSHDQIEGATSILDGREGKRGFDPRDPRAGKQAA